VGGAAFVAIVLVVAVRLRIVSAQINPTKVEGWNPGSKKARRIPETSTNPTLVKNPSFVVRSHRVEKARFETIPV
jgi:hypothetical protein